MPAAPTVDFEQICIAFNPICTVGRPRPSLSIPKDGIALRCTSLTCSKALQEHYYHRGPASKFSERSGVLITGQKLRGVGIGDAVSSGGSCAPAATAASAAPAASLRIEVEYLDEERLHLPGVERHQHLGY